MAATSATVLPPVAEKRPHTVVCVWLYGHDYVSMWVVDIHFSSVFCFLGFNATLHVFVCVCVFQKIGKHSKEDPYFWMRDDDRKDKVTEMDSA